MIRLPLYVASMLAALSIPAFAQPASSFAEPPPKLAHQLPAPPLSEDAGPAEFLRAAEGALVAGRADEAQEAMEMAQTRLLGRSVPLGTTGIPSEQPAVKLISQGLQALAAGDRATCLRMIQAALQATGQP